jgi:hypothetical protein
MDYLRTISYNSLAYFILDRLGLAEVVANSTGIQQVAGNSAKFALAYTGIGEAMDFMDDGRSALTTGQYFTLADTWVWNYLYVMGIQRSRVDYIIDDMLRTMNVPDGDVRVSIINGILLSLGNLLRQVINTEAPKQLRIVTMPTSFLYASSTGNANAYM